MITTETALTKFSATEVDYGVAETTISDLKSRYSGLTIRSNADYEKVRLAIADVRAIRVGVEKSRKELKADALEFGRRVDAEAKRVTALLEEVETPLLVEKLRVDRERAAQRERKEAEARAKAEAEIAEAKRLEEERIATEQAKREAELAAERERLVAERAALEASQRELDAARLEFERARQAELDRANAERAKVQAEREELERAERERLEAIEFAERQEREAREQAEAHAAEERRMAELAPDRDKVVLFAQTLAALEYPKLASEEGKALIRVVVQKMDVIVELLNQFAVSGEVPA